MFGSENDFFPAMAPEMVIDRSDPILVATEQKDGNHIVFSPMCTAVYRRAEGSTACQCLSIAMGYPRACDAANGRAAR